MFIFVVMRAPYMDIDGVFCGPNEGDFNHAVPGECWLYDQKPRYRPAIWLHLITAIPAGFLVIFQFVPSIKRKSMVFHRLNGWLTTGLGFFTTISVLFVTRATFGGDVDIQTAIGLTAIMFLGSLAISIYNIRKLQIEQHRAWMLRAWLYAGSILTLRAILFAASMIMSFDEYYHSMKCAEIATFYPDTQSLVDVYPTCINEAAWVAVKSDYFGRIENTASVLNSAFGMAWWLGLAINAIGVEFYLQLTPLESERLRTISYKRQLKAGFTNPGNAGLTVERLGGAKWRPENKAVRVSQ
ncbi:hypothetical protein F5884DRAFT_796011 [Xylogone sp. PMI_703]|nr:hypothetical protein F5884DRAFT_796011 [Xylogone sp. PMI_703]